MSSAIKFWDNTAEKYSKSPVKNVAAYDKTIERVKYYLKSNHMALEFGCGTGTTALRLADSLDHITATDFSQNMVDIGKKKAIEKGIENIDFKATTLEDPSFDRESYDVIMGFNILHLIKDINIPIKHAHSLLKQDGLFITKTTCLSGSLLFAAIRPLLVLGRWVGKVPYVKYMSIKELEHEITSAGFEIIETGNYPAKPPSRFIVARKVTPKPS